jgi:hypothetical protein
VRLMDCLMAPLFPIEHSKTTHLCHGGGKPRLLGARRGAGGAAQHQISSKHQHMVERILVTSTTIFQTPNKQHKGSRN